MNIQTTRLILPSVLTILLIVITLYAFRHVFLSSDTHLATHGDWDYLWDDAKNFYNNEHMKRPAFTFKNIRWAWSSEGQILGVWEPVSLMVKMLIHDVLDFTGERVGDMTDYNAVTTLSGPRLYRILSACWHTFNVVLAFWVGLTFVRSVNDYDYIAKRLVVEDSNISSGDAKASGKGQKAVTSPLTKRSGKGTKKSSGGDGPVAYASPLINQQAIMVDTESAKRARSYLHRHEVITTLGLFLGTLTFFAVHPLQAQTIGWISCLSYILSCTFALISFWGYVAHRDIMRNWRRHVRAGGRPDDVPGPHVSGIFSSSSSNNNNNNKQTKMGKKKRSAATRSSPPIPLEDRSEVMFWTLPKYISLLCYVCATFCKSPAVTLPLIFIICDVFVYSYPLSSVPVESEPNPNGKGKKIIIRAGNDNSEASGITMFLPNRVIAEFRQAFPLLWNLTIRAIVSWLPFLFTSFVVTIFIVKGNTKHLLDIQTPFEKVQKSVWALCWYATKIIYPSYLVAAVEKLSFSFMDCWEVVASLIAVPYITLVVLAYSTQSATGRVVTCAYGAFIAILLPSLGIIQHGRLFLAADRYAYLPLLIFGPVTAAVFASLYSAMSSFELPSGVLVGGGALPSDIKNDSGSPVRLDQSVIKERPSIVQNEIAMTRTKARLLLALITLSSVLASGLFVIKVTPETLLPWRNSMLLWSKNADIFPETENAHVNLSAAYVNHGNPTNEDFKKALHHTKKALEMRPDSAKYKANLGIMYARLGEYDVVIPFLEKSLEEHPLTRWSPLMHKILAQSLDRKGRFQEAKGHFDTAISLGESQAKSELQNMMNRLKKSDPELAKQLESAKQKPQVKVVGANAQNVKVDVG